MNFQLWSLPPKGDIDSSFFAAIRSKELVLNFCFQDWEKLGNKGWNWTTYEKYHNKAATYVPIDHTTRTDAKSLKATWDLEKRSNGAGPLFVTHPKLKFEIDYKAHDTLLGMGIPEARAPYHGETTGVHIGLSSIEPRTHTRSYAATAYFMPVSTRTNLNVLTTAYAHRLVTTGQGDGNIVATGVEFNYGDEKKVHVAHAKREVIISAGALKSPQILELSGIGREDVLSRIGVPVKISLSGVGENVQEHTYMGTIYELKEDTTTETLDMLRDEKIAAKHIELLAKGEGAFTSGFTNIAWVPLADVTPRSQALYEQEKKWVEEDVKNNSTYLPGLLEQYNIQLERISNGGLDCEFAVTATFLGAGSE
ncbi:hypothetical protein AAF712_010528 [Marasmius tenuissimus]|uniref:Glucose-methanol-choline oxidoreductase N-terminal domain-containing protein n=1 Tax=Marasmius tenuissimus TaxID=585030 RepID=A0ABR2ZNL1_9AGAR